MGEVSKLTHQIIKQEDALIILLQGSVDCTQAARLTEILKTGREESKPKRMILNMTEVAYVDSSGLGVLVAERSRAVRAGIDFSLCGMGGEVKKVFHLAHLDRLFQIFASQEEALQG